jgi:hypothetical protein
MAWDELLEYVNAHGLTPLLYHRLRRDTTLWRAVPAFAQVSLEQGYVHNAQRNLRIFAELAKLMKHLKQDGKPAIVLKGVYLAYTAYRDLALRPMVDIDILVKPTDILHVENILKGLAYRLSDWKHRDWCLKNHYHLQYTNPELHLGIELHWDIQRPLDPYRVNLSELWSQAQPMSVAGVELYGLSLEHMLLYQCLHIAKHGFGVGLRPFCDLAAILRRYHSQIDWQNVQCTAARWRITKAVVLTLHFVDEFFGCVPEAAKNVLVTTDITPDVLETAREQILTVGSTTDQLSSEFVQLWEGRQAGNKMSQLIGRFLLPPDLLAGIYHQSPNSWRVYLYYPVRAFDLLVRYAHIIRQLIRRDASIVTWAEKTSKIDALRDWLVM